MPVDSTPKITIEVANSDFDSVSEYVSRVTVGGQAIGSDYLKSGGDEINCAKLSRIVDAAAAPAGAVSAAGELVVAIETSSAVDCCP